MTVNEYVAPLPAAQRAEPPSLAALQDRAEISDLISRLGVCLDEHRADEMRALFIESASVRTRTGVATGRDAVVGHAMRNHGGFERLQHTTANLLIQLDGDRAGVRANMIVGAVRTGLRPHFLFGAVYNYELVRTDEGWRFAGLSMRQVWRDDKADEEAPQPAAS
jgi:hypothetical protein